MCAGPSSSSRAESRANGLHWYVAGNLFAEDGWRDASPSNVGQVFGKLGRHTAKTDTALSVGYADNSLTGNGLQEQRFLDRDYASVYTKPDETDNRATLRQPHHAARLGAALTLDRQRCTTATSGRTRFNGDINEDSLDQSVYQPTPRNKRALAAAGYTGFPTSGATRGQHTVSFWRCIANVLLNDEPGEKCNGLLNRTESVQHNYGVSGQITWRDWLARGNALTAGAGYDGSRSAFQQSTQLGYLNPDRSVTALDALLTASRAETSTASRTTTASISTAMCNTGSVFASDVLPIGSAWNVTHVCPLQPRRASATPTSSTRAADLDRWTAITSSAA